MKTLKQIREEYNDKFVSQVDDLPEELMLEKKDNGIRHTVPSMKEMPSLLIFRRVSYRLYPNKQVVALYYSKLVDKYLSIPFGPTGNLNLSEAIVADTVDEACWKGYQQYGMKKKGGKKVPNCVPVEEQGSSATRYTERPTYEHFMANVDSLREERLDEFLPLAAAGEMLMGAGARAALGAGVRSVARSAIGRGAKNLIKKGIKYIGKKALDAATDTNKNNQNQNSTQDDGMHHGELIRDKPTAKVTSSWDKAPHNDPVYQSKYKQASLKENKISDIRTMVKEGVDNMDLSINGRSVTLNTSMAKRILEVYDSVNTKNKKIVEGMLNEDLESFKKLLNFSIRN